MAQKKTSRKKTPIAKKTASKKKSSQKKTASKKKVPNPVSVSASSRPVSDSDKYPQVHAACKRGTSPSSYGSKCNSVDAYRMTKLNSKYVSLKCVKCAYVWHVPLGGSMNI